MSVFKSIFRYVLLLLGMLGPFGLAADAFLFRGVLHVEAWRGDCEQAASEVPMSALLIEAKGESDHGYLRFGDERIARLERSDGRDWRILFPRADVAKQNAQWLELHREGDIISGQIRFSEPATIAGSCGWTSASFRLRAVPTGNLEPSVWDLEYKASKNEVQALRYLEKGRFEMALVHVRRAITRAPHLKRIQRTAARIIRLSGDPPRILGVWLYSADTMEGNGKLWLAKAFRTTAAFYYEGMGVGALRNRPELALASFQRAFDLDPENHSLPTRAGFVCERMNRMDEAVAWFQTAAEVALSQKDYLAAQIYHASISRLRELHWEPWSMKTPRLEKRSNAPLRVKIHELNQAALAAQSEARFVEGLEFAQKSYDLARETLGARDLLSLTTLNNLAVLCTWDGDNARGLTLAQRAFQLHLEVLGERHPSTLAAMNNLAVLHHKMGHYARAGSLLQRVTRIREEDLGARHPDTLRSRSNLAGIYRILGQFQTARDQYERNLKNRTEVLGPCHPDTLKSMNGLAGVYRNLGDSQRAASLHERVFHLQKQILGDRHPDTLKSMHDLAVLYQDMAAYDLARGLHEEAWRLRREVLGEDHPDVAESLNALAVLHQNLGAYDRAQSFYERALWLRQDLLGESHPDSLVSLHNLGRLYQEMGAYDRAQLLLERTLRLRREKLGERHPETIDSLNSLARLYQHLGALEQARPLLEQGLLLSRQVLGENHPRTMESRNNIALLHHSLGENARSRLLHEAVLAFRRESLGENHPDTLRSMRNLAAANMAMGEFDRAWPLFERVLKLRREALGAGHPETLDALNHLAYLAATSARWDLARIYFLQSLESANQFNRQLLGFPAPFRYALLAKQEKFRHAYFSFYTSPSRPPEAAFELFKFSLLHKGLSLRVAALLTERAHAESERNPDHHQRFQALKSTRRDFARLYHSGDGKGVGSGLQTSLEELRGEWEREEAWLVRKLGKSGEKTAPDLNAVLAAIPEDGCLLDLHVFREFDFQRQTWAGERALALIVDPGSASIIRMVELGEIGPIESDLAILRMAVSGPSMRDLAIQSAQSLYNRIWAPIQNLVAGKRVYVIPDGLLYQLPLGLLMDEEGHWLASKQTLSLLSSVEDLMTSEHGGGVLSSNPNPPYLVYSPDYEADPAPGDASERAGPGGYRFAGLPGALCEGEMLAALFRERGRPPRQIQGAQATEARVAGIRSPSLLHIATHGLNVEVPNQAVGRRDAARVNQARLAVVQLTPLRHQPISNIHLLLSSGLALAGANAEARGVSADGTDGILTALEVLSMDLRGTDLVVLSACETGIGDLLQDREAHGLSRAFLEAGAKAVLATLWKIDDQATAAFMERFYGLYLDGLSLGEALRLTQRHFIGSENWSHPYYWAPFVLMGEP